MLDIISMLAIKRILSDIYSVSGTCMKFACLLLYIETSSQQIFCSMKSSIPAYQTVVWLL